MKKLFIFLFIFLNIVRSSAQSWMPVGNEGFCMAISDPFVSVSPDNIPYLVCRSGLGASVMKFAENRWAYVGDTIFSEGQVKSTTIDFDKAGVPYVAYSDWSNGKKATVMKYNGTSWIPVGPVGFTQSCATWISLAIDNNNVPYIAYRDLFNQYRASVMKFNGTSWVYVGNAGFSDLGTGYQGASYLSIAFDSKNIPYVGYTDMSNDFKAMVMKFNGIGWDILGNTGISDWEASNTSLVIDNNDIPYIAFWDRANEGKATVKKFDGTTWINVGLPGFTAGAAEFTFLAFDKDNHPYLAYEDYSNSRKASVAKYDGTNWVNIGNSGFSKSRVYYTTMAIDANNNIYVGYQDCNTSGCDYATVMKYESDPVKIEDEVNNEISFNVYPNPTKDILYIQYLNAKIDGPFLLKITTVLGANVYYENLIDINGKLNKEVNLKNFSKGMYFVELASGDNREIRKVIIE